MGGAKLCSHKRSLLPWQVEQAMENLRLVFGEEVPEPAAVHVTRWSQVHN